MFLPMNVFLNHFAKVRCCTLRASSCPRNPLIYHGLSFMRAARQIRCFTTLFSLPLLPSPHVTCPSFCSSGRRTCSASTCFSGASRSWVPFPGSYSASARAGALQPRCDRLCGRGTGPAAAGRRRSWTGPYLSHKRRAESADRRGPTNFFV
jgi:hypothetical protein